MVSQWEDKQLFQDHTASQWWWLGFKSRSVWCQSFFCFLIQFNFKIFGCSESSLLCGLSLVGESWPTLSSCRAWASHCSGFFHSGAQALGCQASAVAACGLSSCGFQALECRLSSCVVWAQLFCSLWDLPWSGIKLMSPALAGRFFTTEPREMPWCQSLWL